MAGRDQLPDANFIALRELSLKHRAQRRWVHSLASAAMPAGFPFFAKVVEQPLRKAAFVLRQFHHPLDALNIIGFAFFKTLIVTQPGFCVTRSLLRYRSDLI